jgi:23S rRNA-/tRNA-specific pseudouridylate synthase
LTHLVQPYIYEFKTFAKGRWLGRALLDVLTTEFGGFDSAYWKDAIKDSNILVNNSPTSEAYIVKNSDELVHRTHRHEPPVFGAIALIGETEDLIAVCKPASMPSKWMSDLVYDSPGSASLWRVQVQHSSFDPRRGASLDQSTSAIHCASSRSVLTFYSPI